MANPQHIAWLKEGAGSWNTRRHSQRFDPDLSSEDISRALGGHDREDVRQISVHLRGVNLSGANLSNSTLRDTDLTGANFNMANMANAKLTGSDFTGAQFVGGTSKGARFHSAQLVKTFFLDHDLTGAQFNGSQLARAKFIQCTLKGAHLYSEALTDVDFIMSRPWSSLLFSPSVSPSPSSQAFDERGISGINDLLDRCREFWIYEHTHMDVGSSSVRFIEAVKVATEYSTELRPEYSVHQHETIHRQHHSPGCLRRAKRVNPLGAHKKVQMLDDLMTRFILSRKPSTGQDSALDRKWVLAQLTDSRVGTRLRREPHSPEIRHWSYRPSTTATTPAMAIEAKTAAFMSSACLDP